MPREPLTQEVRSEPSPFAITAGGPFYWVLMRLHVRQPKRLRRYFALGLVVWAPLAIAELVHIALGEPLDPMMRDLSVHVRILVALPLMLASEMLLDGTVSSSLRSFYHGNFCDRARADDIVEGATKLRDFWPVEVAIAVIALLGGQFTLWGVFGATGLFHGETPVQSWWFGRVWYVLLVLPLVQFVMIRWLWHWLIWTYIAFRISRLPLSILATHADYAGGLASLARPVTASCGFVLAASCIISSAWGTQLVHHTTKVEELLPGLAVFLIAALAFACGPLLPLTGQLFRARRKTLAQYGDFVRHYDLLFHAKWIAPQTATTASPLGTPDLQSLSDIGQSFQFISKTRVFVFGPRQVFTVWFSAILPMIPLFLSTLTPKQVLGQVLKTVLGGLPF